MAIQTENKNSKKKSKVTAKKNKEKVSNKIKEAITSSDDEFVCSKETVKRSIKYYLQNTTLHGLKYIAEDKITITERIFFGLSFLLVVLLSGFFISNVYVKWSASPIIISTSAKQTMATKVPFPAITICNLNLALKSKVKTIPKRSANYSLLMSLCDQGDDLQVTFKGTWKNFRAVLIDVAQPCEQMLLYCSFGAKNENCSLIFNSLLTDDGLCCTFNALDPVFMLRNDNESRISPEVNDNYTAIPWTAEKGYDGNLPDRYYPRTSGGTGKRMGLTVVLNASSSEYYCSKSKSHGFKVLVHNPAELPKISNYGFLVTAGRETRIPIQPIYEDAIPSIRSIKKQVRRCLFSDEGDLIYFKTYSRKNCELECEAKILIRECDCMLYYLPLLNSSVNICGPKDNTCTNRIQAAIESTDNNISCASCLPACFELSYRVTLTSTKMTDAEFLCTDEYPSEILNVSNKDIGDLSILNFYYTSNAIRSTTKSEMFGFTEFLSNTGGLLGLFMGFSIFSLIELVYYVTVRPYCALRTMDISRRRKRLKHTLPKFLKRKSPKKVFTSKIWNMDTPKKNFNNLKYKNNLDQILLQQNKIKFDNTLVYPYVD